MGIEEKRKLAIDMKADFLEEIEISQNTLTKREHFAIKQNSRPSE